MPKLTQLEEFASAIKIFALDAEPGTSNTQAASDFYEVNRELVSPFIDEWAIQKLATLIGKHRKKARRASIEQLSFEESLGFTHLPRTIDVYGKTIPRGKATIQAFRALVTQLRKQKSAALEEAQRAVALMAPYAAVKKDNRITWAEVVKREAAKR
jgi:hypothetical protein